MALDLDELIAMSDDMILARAQKDPAWFRRTLIQLDAGVSEDRQHCQLAYYAVRNPDALGVHTSLATEIAIAGGNRSSKTTTALAELAIQLTGIVPVSLRGVYPKEKLRAPIRARVICNSLTDTLEPVIKPKLRYDQWNGIGAPADGRGHWGLIPRHLLVDDSWEESYSEKYRTLTVAVDNYWGNNSSREWSKCQFMSYDQDLSTFAGSSQHLIVNDELCPQDIYRESRMRILDVQGRIITAFTPPDEAGISRGDTSWFFDNVYDKGLTGPYRDKRIESFTLMTEQNSVLNRDDIRELERTMTEEQREVRLRGRFIHLSGVIYSMFSSSSVYWCYKCERKVLPTTLALESVCPHCRGSDVETFCHVIEPFVLPMTWPTVFVIDPHPRKPDAIGWFAVSPGDDYILVKELEVGGTADDVAKAVRDVEKAYRFDPMLRIMDPNMATETHDKFDRGWTFRRAYEDVGLACEMGVDDLNTGIQEVQQLLKPDRYTRRPRLSVFNTCEKFIAGMRNWTWDEYARSGDRPAKERPRDLHKDFPDVARYFACARVTYSGLKGMSQQVIRPAGKRGPRGY